MIKRVLTATAIAVIVLSLGVLERAAGLPIEGFPDKEPDGGPATGAEPTPAPTPGALIIVAAGDSYASGEGAADHTSLLPDASWGGTNNDGGAVRCHRSTLAGAANAATRLTAFGPVGFFNFACSGSTTGSISGQLGTIATQLGRLGLGDTSAPIDALVISIGGNDIGFAGIVATCMAPGFTCDGSGLSTSLAALPSSLDSAFGLVNGGSAGTVRHVFVTAYPDPTTGPFGLPCGTPITPAFEGFEGIDASEALWASANVVTPLNAALSAAVARANAAPGTHPRWHFVSAIESSFHTHGYCAGGGSPVLDWWPHPRYVNTVVDSLTGQGDVMGAMHPNNQGYSEIGAILASTIVSALTSVPAPTPATKDGPVEKVCRWKLWLDSCE